MDLDFFKTAQKIEDALLKRDTGPCLSWCQDNKSKLKRIKVLFYVFVHVQVLSWGGRYKEVSHHEIPSAVLYQMSVERCPPLKFLKTLQNYLICTYMYVYVQYGLS